MKDGTIVKTPFFRLLVPLIIGIILQYFLDSKYWSEIFFLFGAGIMFFSFFVPLQKEYALRWLFGTGLFLLLISIGIFSTQLRQEDAKFDFGEGNRSYLGTVTDIPKIKEKSVACNVSLKGLNYNPVINKNIVCYLQPDGVSRDLQPGDMIRFYGQIEPIQNYGNPNEFDYKQYMYNQGFSGSIYLPTNRWEPAFDTDYSIGVYALRCRSQILAFFKSLGLNDTEQSIVAALIVGYQDTIPEDVKEAFRTTGTAHVLSVSGMHVGIIFAIIMFLLGFIRKRSKIYWLKFSITIILLWLYAFITGFSPPVIRACIMLSAFCIAQIFGRKGISYNTIFFAAFLILIYDPFSLFDVGFQLSFMAVFAIYYLNPRIEKLWKIENKAVRYLWGMFSLSVSAQIGTAPLCLYYFGYFPAYFFITNILITPLVGLITYLMLFVSAIANFPLLKNVLDISLLALKFMIEFMTKLIHFFETLPYARLEDLNISLISVFLLIGLMFSLTHLLEHKRTSALILTLSLIALLIIVPLPNRLKKIDNELWVYNLRDETRLTWNKGSEQFVYIPDSVNRYKFIKLNEKTFLSVAGKEWEDMTSDSKFDIDYLHLSAGADVSLIEMSRLFNFKTVILDNSLPFKNIKRFKNEAKVLGINCYNIKEKGAYHIVF